MNAALKTVRKIAMSAAHSTALWREVMTAFRQRTSMHILTGRMTEAAMEAAMAAVYAGRLRVFSRERVYVTVCFAPSPPLPVGSSRCLLCAALLMVLALVGEHVPAELRMSANPFSLPPAYSRTNTRYNSDRRRHLHASRRQGLLHQSLAGRNIRKRRLDGNGLLRSCLCIVVYVCVRDRACICL